MLDLIPCNRGFSYILYEPYRKRGVMNQGTQRDRVDGDKIILHVPNDFKSGVFKGVIIHTSDGKTKEYRIIKTKPGKFMMQK